MAPLYAFLTSRRTNPAFGGEITWNFNKFLIGRDGKVIARFDSNEEPSGDRVTKAVDGALVAD
jgi:glutathione peroxidase